MIEIDKNGTKVDLEFNFASIRLGINFPCMISICVTTNTKTSETEEADFTISADFKSLINRKLKTSAVLFPHKANQVDFNVTIVTKRGRKSAGVVKFDIGKVLGSNQSEFTEPLVNCPDKHAMITFGVRVFNLIHLSINENMNKSPIQKGKVGASFYSVVNYGQDTSTNQSKQLNNSSYSLNIHKKDGKSQSPAHNVIFRFQSKKNEIEEYHDNWSKQLPSSKDLNNSGKLEDCETKVINPYNSGDMASKLDSGIKFVDADALEIKKNVIAKKDKEIYSASKGLKDGLMSDLKRQITSLGDQNGTLQNKLGELNIEYTILVKENNKLKEDNAKYHRQLLDYKAINVDELQSNYDLIRNKLERAIKDLDKQEEELFDAHRKLDEKSKRVEELERQISRSSVTELSNTMTPSRPKALSSTWADRLGTLEKDVTLIHTKFANLYSINSEEDIKKFDKKLKERIDKEDYLESKIRGLEEDKIFLDKKIEENDNKIEEIELALKKSHLELENARLDYQKQELAFKNKLDSDSEEWEFKFTNLANEYKSTINKLKDNNVNLQKKYEDMLANLDEYRAKNEKDFKSRLDKYRVKFLKLDLALKQFEDGICKEYINKAAEISHLEISLREINERYRDEISTLTRKVEIIKKAKREETSKYKGRLEMAQIELSNFESSLEDSIIEKIIVEKYLECVLNCMQNNEDEHMKNMSKVIDTFITEKEMRKAYWDDYKSSKEEEISEIKEKFITEKLRFGDEIDATKGHLSKIMDQSSMDYKSFENLQIEFEAAENQYAEKLKNLKKKKQAYKQMIDEMQAEKHDSEDNNSTYVLKYEEMMNSLRKECIILKKRVTELEDCNMEQETDIQNFKSEKEHLCEEFMKISVNIRKLKEEAANITACLENLMVRSSNLKFILLYGLKSLSLLQNHLTKVFYSRLSNLNNKTQSVNHIIRMMSSKISLVEGQNGEIAESTKLYIEKLQIMLHNEYDSKLVEKDKEISLISEELCLKNSKVATIKEKLTRCLGLLKRFDNLTNSVTYQNLNRLNDKLAEIESTTAENKARIHDSSTYYSQIEETYTCRVNELEVELQSASLQVESLNRSLSYKEEEYIRNLEQAEEKHKENIIELQNSHNATITTLKAEHQNEIEYIYTKNKETVESIQKGHENEIKNLRLSHEEELFDVITKFNSEIEELKTNANLKNELKSSSLEKEIELLKERKDKELRETELKFEQSLSEVRTQYTSRFGMLKEDVHVKEFNRVQILMKNIKSLETTNEECKNKHEYEIENLLKNHQLIQDELQLIKDDKIHELELKIQELQNFNEEKSQTYDEMIEGYKAQIELLEETLKELESENNTFKEKIHILEQGGNEQIQEYSALLVKKDEEHKNQIDRLERKKKDLVAKVQEMENVIKSLNLAQKDLQHEHDMKLAEIEKMSKNIEILELENVKLNIKIEEETGVKKELTEVHEVEIKNNKQNIIDLNEKIGIIEAKKELEMQEKVSILEKLSVLEAEKEDLIEQHSDMATKYESEIEEFKGHIIDLEVKLSTQEQRIDVLIAEREAKNDEITRIKEDLKQSRDRIVELSKGKDSLSEYLKQLDKQNKENELKIETITLELENANLSLDLLKEDIQNKDAIITDVEENNTNLKNELANAKKEIQVKIQEIKELEDNLSSSRGLRTDYDKHMDELKNLVDSKDSELTKAQEELNVKDKIIASTAEKNRSYSLEVEKLHEEFTTLQEIIETNDQLLKEMESDLNEKTAELNSALEKLKSTKTDISILEQKLQVSNQQVSSLSDQLSASDELKSELHNQNLKLKQVNDERDQNIANLVLDVEKYKKIVEELHKKIENLNDCLKDYQEQNEKKSKELDKLNHQIELKDSKITDLKERLDQNNDKRDEYVTEIQDKLQISKQEIIELQNNILQQNKEKGKLEAKLELITKERDEIHQEIERKEIGHHEMINSLKIGFEEKENKLREENKNQIQEISSLSKQTANLNDNLSRVEKELAKIISEYEKSLKNIEELEKHIIKLRKENADLEKNIELKENDLKHVSLSLEEKKKTIVQLTEDSRDLELKHSNLEKEFVEYKHTHQNDINGTDRLVKENEMLKENAKLIGIKSVDGKTVEKLTAKLEDLENQLSRRHEIALREKEELNSTITSLREELIRKANSIDIEVYQQIEKAYVTTMAKIGDALNIVKSLKLKSNDKDKIIACLIA